MICEVFFEDDGIVRSSRFGNVRGLGSGVGCGYRGSLSADKVTGHELGAVVSHGQSAKKLRRGGYINQSRYHLSLAANSNLGDGSARAVAIGRAGAVKL